MGAVAGKVDLGGAPMPSTIPNTLEERHQATTWCTEQELGPAEQWLHVVGSYDGRSLKSIPISE